MKPPRTSKDQLILPDLKSGIIWTVENGRMPVIKKGQTSPGVNQTAVIKTNMELRKRGQMPSLFIFFEAHFA